MRIIHLDLLTKEFFRNDFPGFRDTVDIDQDNLLGTNVPFVELELDVNTKDILDIVKNLSEENIELHERKDYKGEKHKRVTNVSSKLLWSDGKKEGWITDIYYKKRGPNYPAKETTTETQEIKDLLYQAGIDATLCWLHTLEPGGYFRPHRDVKMDTTPLDYFWIPLNIVPGAQLRSYPHGEINVSLGNAYLLNNDYYVHGVYNGGNETRYVLLGHINHDVTNNLKELISQSLIKNYVY